MFLTRVSFLTAACWNAITTALWYQVLSGADAENSFHEWIRRPIAAHTRQICRTLNLTLESWLRVGSSGASLNNTVNDSLSRLHSLSLYMFQYNYHNSRGHCSAACFLNDSLHVWAQRGAPTASQCTNVSWWHCAFRWPVMTDSIMGAPAGFASAASPSTVQNLLNSMMTMKMMLHVENFSYIGLTDYSYHIDLVTTECGWCLKLKVESLGDFLMFNESCFTIGKLKWSW